MVLIHMVHNPLNCQTMSNLLGDYQNEEPNLRLGRTFSHRTATFRQGVLSWASLALQGVVWGAGRPSMVRSLRSVHFPFAVPSLDPGS